MKPSDRIKSLLVHLRQSFFFTLVDTHLIVIINSIEGEFFVNNLHFLCFTSV